MKTRRICPGICLTVLLTWLAGYAEAQVVNKTATTTSLNSFSSPSMFSQTVTFAAAVSPATATGTVTFFDGSTSIGTGTLSAGPLTVPPPGSWSYFDAVTHGEHSVIRNGVVYGPLDARNTSFTNSGLAEINPSSGVVNNLFTGASIPNLQSGCVDAAPAFDNAGYLWMWVCTSANNGFTGLVRIDPATGASTLAINMAAYNSTVNDWEAVSYDSVHNLVFASAYATLYAFDASTGDLVWTKLGSSSSNSTEEVAPVLVQGVNPTYLYWKAPDGGMHKIYAASGVNQVSSSATVVLDGNVSYGQIIYDAALSDVLVTNADNIAFILDGNTLDTVSTYTVETGYCFDRGSAFNPNAGVWFVTARQCSAPYSSKVYALSTTGGTLSLLWTNTSALDNQWEISSLLADDNYVYASVQATEPYNTTGKGYLFAIDALSGDLVSTFDLADSAASSIPSVYGGKFIVGLWDDSGYQAVQVSSSGGTGNFLYKADANMTGYVQPFTNNGQLLTQTAWPSTGGPVQVATFTTNALAVASHSITASYSGDGNDAVSTSPSLTQMVIQDPTTTSLTSSLNPSPFGQSVTFTATVSRSAATGTITFKDGSSTLGTGTLSGGSATFTISTLASGSHSITAVYGGDTNDATSTSAVLSQTVSQTATTTVVTSSLNPSTFGQSVTFTANVTPTSATGTLTFMDGLTTLGTGTLNGGTAAFTTSALVAGSHSITAVYGGDTNDAISTSAALGQTVNRATPVLSWTSPAAIIFGSALGSSQLDATASVPGSFVYSPAAGTVLFAGANQTLSAVFTPADTADYNGGTVTTTITVNPAPSGPIDVSSQVSVTGSGLTYNRSTKLYTGTVTIKNTGSVTITGPILAVFTNLTSGATLTNQTGLVPSGAYAGAPYITTSATTLAPGASVTFGVQYSYSGTAPISYVVKTLSGVF